MTATGPVTDPIDVYSQVTNVSGTRLGTRYELPQRRDPAKPGRSLSVAWDARFPVVPGLTVSYSYVMRFDQPGGVAGNHFHRKKQELFYPVHGEFTVVLADLESGEREQADMSGAAPFFLHVPVLVAHAVVARSAGACLLVLADAPNATGDEFGAQIC